MNRLTDAKADGVKTDGAAILDRSRAQLRLPSDMISETLRMAHVQSIPDVERDAASERPSPETISRLEAGGILSEGTLDPVAFELLDVVNQASLVVAVDLRFKEDSSVPTVWSTPRRAVICSSLDPNYMEFRPVPVTQLPQVLGELIVLRTPEFIGDVPISISGQILSKAENLIDDREAAMNELVEGGLDLDQAVLMLDLQRPDVRRWKIGSTWSTDDGQEGAELRGLDAGPSGQWLIGATGSEENEGQVTFNPLGHGEIMSAFRSVLPKNWMGTPLNRPV